MLAKGMPPLGEAGAGTAAQCLYALFALLRKLEHASDSFEHVEDGRICRLLAKDCVVAARVPVRQ